MLWKSAWEKLCGRRVSGEKVKSLILDGLNWKWWWIVHIKVSVDTWGLLQEEVWDWNPGREARAEVIPVEGRAEGTGEKPAPDSHVHCYIWGWDFSPSLPSQSAPVSISRAGNPSSQILYWAIPTQSREVSSYFRGFQNCHILYIWYSIQILSVQFGSFDSL